MKEILKLVEYVTAIYLENTESGCDEPQLRTEIEKINKTMFIPKIEYHGYEPKATLEEARASVDPDLLKDMGVELYYEAFGIVAVIYKQLISIPEGINDGQYAKILDQANIFLHENALNLIRIDANSGRLKK